MPPPAYSAIIMLEPMFCICCSRYCLPVRPMVTTRMSDAVPITIPSEVRMNRILPIRNVWNATLNVSPKTNLGYRRPLLPSPAILEL